MMTDELYQRVRGLVIYSYKYDCPFHIIRLNKFLETSSVVRRAVHARLPSPSGYVYCLGLNPIRSRLQQTVVLPFDLNKKHV